MILIRSGATCQGLHHATYCLKEIYAAVKKKLFAPFTQLGYSIRVCHQHLVVLGLKQIQPKEKKIF